MNLDSLVDAVFPHNAVIAPAKVHLARELAKPDGQWALPLDLEDPERRRLDLWFSQFGYRGFGQLRTCEWFADIKQVNPLGFWKL